MKVELTDEIVRDPVGHIPQWMAVIDSAPTIACRFHEELMKVSHHALLPKKYYLTAARYLVDHGISTRAIDADMMVAFADNGQSRWQLSNREGSYTRGPFSHTVPQHPVSATSAMELLSGCSQSYGTFFRAYKPETEDELYDLVNARPTGLTLTKTKMVRSAFRRRLDLIEDHARFIRLNVKWCNEAVFPKMCLEDRKLICKEHVLASVKLEGIPMEVYARGREASLWILQSTEWTDKEKAAALNQGLVRVSKSREGAYRASNSKKNVFFEDTWWQQQVPEGCNSDGQPPQHRYYRAAGQFVGPRLDAGDYYGPVLFPEKVEVDLAGRLNPTGLRNLAGYLNVAQLKIRVKLNRDEEENLLAIVSTNPDLLEKVKKHLVKE